MPSYAILLVLSLTSLVHWCLQGGGGWAGVGARSPPTEK